MAGGCAGGRWAGALAGLLGGAGQIVARHRRRPGAGSVQRSSRHRGDRGQLGSTGPPTFARWSGTGAHGLLSVSRWASADCWSATVAAAPRRWASSPLPTRGGTPMPVKHRRGRRCLQRRRRSAIKHTREHGAQGPQGERHPCRAHRAEAAGRAEQAARRRSSDRINDIIPHLGKTHTALSLANRKLDEGNARQRELAQGIREARDRIGSGFQASNEQLRAITRQGLQPQRQRHVPSHHHRVHQRHHPRRRPPTTWPSASARRRGAASDLGHRDRQAAGAPGRGRR